MALRDLADLRQDTAEMCQDLARIELAAARGTPFPLTLAEVVSAHPLSCSRDGLDQARETLASARGAGRVARLASLRDFLVRARALELEPGAAQEAWELPRRPSVLLPGDPGLHGALPPVAVERDLPFVREREQRAAMESALAAVWRSAVSVQTALWEAAREALSELELGEPARAALALHERGWPAPRRAEPAEPVPPAIPAARPAEIKDSALVRAPPPPLPVQDAVTEACESFLRDTEPLARDLGSWLLERHTGARAGGAERHDLLHFLHAPRFSGAFPRGELVRTVRRWAETLRLDLTAGGAISLEEEERALQPAGSRAVAVDPPHEVRVVVRPAEGPRALAGLLSAAGRARLRAGPPEDAPPEDLWFGDAGLLPACGALLEGLLLDSAFLRRCARAELPRDDERALGVAALLDARLDAARALGSLLALREGLGAAAGQAARELHSRAALTEFPAALALRELDPWLQPWADLRGRALAAHLRASLRERFDEDFWRNPRALPALQGLWSRGGRPTLAELWEDTGGKPSLQALTAELFRACE
ncbi:MAG TPA: hypothetical protein VKB92_12580 [Myxococcales bacterium]|nr:hypothetical protein [Myxococcales bacterium]